MNRRCLVTGASRGIGRSITRELQLLDYEVVGLARKRPDWWSGEFVECDLSSQQSLYDAMDYIRGLENIWGLVNNAGVGKSGAVDALKYEDMQLVFSVNSIAPAMLTKAVVPLMADGGRIVNICSNVLLGKPQRTAYGASKAALASMTRTWALELSPRGICVNGISPGPIDTDLFRRRHPNGSDAEAAVVAGIPVGQIGAPSQVASLVSFFMAPENYYVTGQVVTVDGGMTIAATSA